MHIHIRRIYDTTYFCYDIISKQKRAKQHVLFKTARSLGRRRQYPRQEPGACIRPDVASRRRLFPQALWSSVGGMEGVLLV